MKRPPKRSLAELAARARFWRAFREAVVEESILMEKRRRATIH